MKYILILIFSCLFIYSCTVTEARTNETVNTNIPNIKSGYINGHRYYYYNSGHKFGITHAADCPVCIKK